MATGIISDCNHQRSESSAIGIINHQNHQRLRSTIDIDGRKWTIGIISDRKSTIGIDYQTDIRNRLSEWKVEAGNRNLPSAGATIKIRHQNRPSKLNIEIDHPNQPSKIDHPKIDYTVGHTIQPWLLCVKYVKLKNPSGIGYYTTRSQQQTYHSGREM